MESLSTVFVVGDVYDVRESLNGMISSGQLALRRFDSADEALEYCEPQMPGCFVLDQLIRGTVGLQVHKKLHAKGCQQPFIYVMQDKDVASAVEAMQQGAVDCIERPLDCGRLREGIQQAIARDAEFRQRQGTQALVLARVASLTTRERQILEYVASGNMTKSIARRLDISTKTVEVHRSNIMRKMHVQSAAELLHLVAKHSLFPFASESD
jgi:two-component system response regulator FixJ